ncbi:SdpI family protein [Vibrio mangrovi]|uniref:SdpI family protein n=1 Tax=Vibrio mangrovi TaxID=474394 RepID=A0A1Y6IYA2_9VIBR|nr:SdpI family protein [Vibrio mangrovi]MDW6005163.1 SdpI family protein [Vibrio mangrovi]SMS02627.1 hypothetical protein VIM7927_03961 [Vibrio mangrovi]
MGTSFLLLSIGSLIFLITALPLAFGKVRPNRFYGVRIKLTFSDQQQWYRINRIYGWAMTFSVIAFFLITRFMNTWQDEQYEVLNLILFVAQVIVSTLVVVFFVRRSGKEGNL